MICISICLRIMAMYLARLRNWCKLIKNYFWNYFQFRIYVLHIHLSTCIMWLNVSSEMQQSVLPKYDWLKVRPFTVWLTETYALKNTGLFQDNFIYMCWWDLKGELLKNTLSIFIQQMRLSNRICCCLTTVRYVQIKIHPWLEKLKNFLLK